MDVQDAPPPGTPQPMLPGAPAAPVPAPAGKRILAALISIAIYLALFIPAVVTLILAFVDSTGTKWILALLLGLLALVGTVLLDIWYVGSRSATVGHSVMGLRMIRYSTGASVGYDRAAIRWAGRIVADILQVGLVLAFANLFMILSADNRRHLLDLLADTMVVEAPPR